MCPRFTPTPVEARPGGNCREFSRSHPRLLLVRGQACQAIAAKLVSSVVPIKAPCAASLKVTENSVIKRNVSRGVFATWVT